MAYSYKTLEVKAFQEHYDKLVDSIQEADLPVLGARFFSRQIISRETMEMVGNVTISRAVRTSKLMLAVMAHLDIHPHKFESALDVFKKEHVYTQLSNMIKEDYGKLATSLPLPQTIALPSTAIGKYAMSLQRVYLRSKLPVRGKWPPSPCKKIIKLAAIERKMQSSKMEKFSHAEALDEYMQENSMMPISMDDLLTEKAGTLPKTIVVQGVPGISKSTFAWKFCRKWAKGKLKEQFDLVVLLRMRDTKVRQAKELSDLFYCDSKKLSDDLVEEVFQSGGKGIVFLLEGLDELPASCLADGTPLSNLLQGESLPESTILVTTRPWAAQTLMEKCEEHISRRVEILGFTKEDILKYTSYVFEGDEDKQSEFLEYLHSHPQLESIMHIPLNAAFVVQIYKQLKYSQQAIPQTLTQLYTALVKGLILRYVKSTLEFRDFMSVDLNKLPEPIQAQFQQLCLLAFMSFTKMTIQVTFTDSESALYGCLDSLGLMQSSADVFIDSGTEITHSFLHFTIQEFLAAYHLSKQLAEVQKLFIETHNQDRQFHMILRFLVGLKISTLQYFPKPRKSVISGNHLLERIHLHWLYESQSPDDICRYLGDTTVYRNSTKANDTFDQYALTYCLCHSNCKWNVSFYLPTLVSVCQTHLTYGGVILSLQLSKATPQGICTVFSLPKYLFSYTSQLVIYSRQGDKEAELVLPGIDILPQLQQFFAFGAISVVHSLCNTWRGLDRISLEHMSFTSSDVLELCKYITSPDRSLMLSLTLTEIIECEGGGLQLLISSVARSHCLTHLNLSRVRFTTKEMEIMSIALSTNVALQNLILSWCLIDGEGAKLLGKGLKENQSLIELDLASNRIDQQGATALARMLTVNTALKKLILSNNPSIGINGVIKLINALDQNSTLEKLYLPSNCEPVEYRSILMENIRESGRVEFL